MTAVNGETFRAVDAASGEAVEPAFAVSTMADVDAACAAAAEAFDSYRGLPSPQRAAFLEAIAEEIVALGDALLERAASESGLPLARLTSERGRTVGQLRLFADVVRADRWRGVRIDPALPERQPMPRSDLRLRMVPLGPVAVFGASNFPLAFSTAGGDTASALAAGCPVVVKGHPAHPGTDTMVAEAIARAAARTGMPAGTFGHIRGPGNDLGAALVGDPRIAAVGFTGSRAGGLALARIARERDVPIPVYAEMSSVNPVILMPGALTHRAAALGTAFTASLTLGAGQFCTNPGLVLAVGGKGFDTFVYAAAAAMANHEPQTMLTPGIRQAYADGAARLAADPATREAGRGRAGNGQTSEASRLFEVEASEVVANPALLEEVFGASSLIVRCSSHDELTDLLRSIEGQLTATIHMDAEDRPAAAALVPVLERKCGRIIVNEWPTGVEVTHAMVHGGPYPATSDGRTTSVGTLAIERFLRPVCYQNMPQDLLPTELRDGCAVPRLVDGAPG